MKKRVLSLFMALALCLTMLPTAALAEEAGAAPDTGNVESVYTIGDDTVVQIGEESDPVQVAQALIDALPEDVTAENAEEIEQQLMALEAALEALTEEQLALLDMTRYEALCAALVSQVSLTAERGGEHADHPICGAAHTDIGNHTEDKCADVTWTAWDGTSDIVYDSSNTAYVYLSGNAEREETLEIRDGYTLYLCLNGYSLTKTTEDSNPSFEGVITIYKGAQFTLCDCRGGGKITHAAGKLGRGVRCGDSSGSATFAMFGGEISGNHVGTSKKGQDGAGVETQNATFNMYGGRIINNEVAVPLNNDGGGVCAHTGGSFTMYGGEISGNTSARDGGGVSVVGVPFTMKGGSITNNTASAGNGGGAALYNGRFELSGGTITNNSATRNGGGVYTNENLYTGCTVSGSVNITGNKNAAGADNNVYLSSGVHMIVTGELKNVIGVTTESVPSASNVVMIAADGGYMTEAMKDHFVYDLAGDCKSVYDSTNRAIYLKVIPHEHPICGATHTNINGHTGECSNVKWTAWDGVSDITYDENNTAYVYLTTNAERTSALEIAQGNTLYLCLNGKSLTMNKGLKSVISVVSGATLSLCDCSDAQTGKLTHGTNNKGEKYDGYGINVKGTVNLYSGSITGNCNSYGGGVSIADNSSARFYMYGGSINGNTATSGDGGGGVHLLYGKFYMYGGSITGNGVTDAKVTYGGGGVFVGYGATFYMSGGSITGNTASKGGGMYINGGRKLEVSGNVQITGNTKSATNSAASNVYADGGSVAAFTIGADGLRENARIGVTAADTIDFGSYVSVGYGDVGSCKAENFSADAGKDYDVKVETVSGRTDKINVNLYYGLHEHYICGGDTCTGVGHTCGEKVTFKAWSGASGKLPTESGYYYLTDNMTLTTEWEPSEGSNIVLCLNGKTITAKVGTKDTASLTHDSIDIRKGVTVSMTDCVGTGTISRSTYDQRAVNVWGGTFNLYGGKITGFKADATSGGGVAIASNGIFNMYGGAITKNTSSYGGGGVHVGYFNSDAGTFNMYGGSITGNTSSGDGAGVRVSRNATMTISGNVKITGNKKDYRNTTTDNNVYLPRNKTINVTGPLTGGADSIGVTTTDSLISGCFIAIANGTDSYTLTDNEKDAFSEDEGSRFTSKLLRDNTLLLTRFSDIPMHEHALCGAVCEDGAQHANELWQPLTYYSSSQDLYCGPAEASRSTRNGYTADNKETKYYTYTIPSGNYCLTEDLTLGGDGGSITGGTLVISGDVKLCLNGKTLSTTLAAYSINVIRVDLDSSLTLCDCSTDGSGKITSENKVYNCVQPYRAQGTSKASGKFTMYGGAITGAYNGVVINDADSVALYGGTITGNTVGVSAKYPVTIGGTVNITGNTNADVQLLNKSTTGLIKIDPSLTQDSHIGVSSEQELSETIPSVKIATGARGTLDYTKIFTPDVTDQDYIITKDAEGNLYLTKHTHNWSYTADDETGTITANCSNADGNCPLNGGDGGSVTLTKPEHAKYGDGKEIYAQLTPNNWQPELPANALTYKKNGEPTSDLSGAGKYTVTLTIDDKSVSVDYTVKKAKLTIKAKDNTIVYGDTASDKGVTYSGFVNGENESVLGGELTYAFDNYIPGSKVGAYTITPAGKTSGNYDITFDPGTLTVTQREVTLTWHNYENRTYGDGKYVFATAGNLLEADVGKVQVNVMGNAANASGTFTATAFKLTGDKADNYKLPENATKEYTIGLAEQKLTFEKTGDQSVTYGETLANPAANNRADGSEVTYSSSDPNVATVDENGTVTAKSVGTTIITATAAAVDGKYGEAKATYQLTVTARPISLTITPVTYYYGQPGLSFTPSLRTVSGSLAEGDDYKTLKLSWSSVGTMWKAGTFDVNATSDNSNYNVTFGGTGKLIVLPRPITVTVDPASRTYGEANPTFTAKKTGGMDFVGSDTVDSLGLSLSSTATATSGVGSYDVTGTASNTNYNVTVLGEKKLTITPKAITVTVNEATRPYGEANPTFTATAPSNTLVGEDTIESLGLSLTTAADTTSPVGSYNVTGSASNTNYTVTVDGMNKLTVNPKELKANDLELTGSFVKTYDGNVNATAVGARVKSGVLVGNDTLNITGSAVYNSEDVKDANSITFTPNAITEGNYRLAAAEKVTVTEEVKINRRTITIASVQATSKQYDGDTTAYSCITSVTFNGLVEGETLTKSGLQNGTYVTGDYGINSANFNSANVNEANKITGEVGITNPNLNYTFKESGKETSTAPFTTTGSITPANSWSLTPVTDLTIRYNNRDLRTYTPNWSTLLPSGQTWTYSASTATTGSAALSTNTIGADTGVLSYQLSAGNVSDTATWTVTASCANYQSFTLAVTLTLIARDEQTGFKFENNTTSVTKTYGDEDFTIAASGGATGSSVTYTSSDETVAKVDEDGKVTIVGAGITTIKAKASETADFEEKEISYTLTVKPKTLVKDDLTYSGSITKVYDGSTNAPSGLTVSVDPSSLVNGDTLTVNGTLKFNSANVGEASEITFIPTAITTGNYTLAATEALTIRSASITAKEVTLTSGINATNRSYAKDNKTVALTKGTLAFTGLVSGETLDVNIPDTGTIFDTKVGTYNVTYSGVTLKDGTTGKASNYKLVGSLPAVTVTISKAAAPVLADIPVSFKYTVTTGEKAIGNAGIPADAGTLTYSKGTATKTGTVTVTSWDVDSTTGKVTYTLSGGKAGDSATLFVTIASTNYEDATVNVVITLTARDNQVELRITGGTTVVYGQTLALNTSGGSGSGAVTYTVVNGTGEATIDPNTGVLTPVKVGSVSVIATKAGDNDYNAVTSAPVEITITKATPTGEPKYTEIKTGGKTLADAALTIEGSTLKPNAGTLEWVDDKGNVLSNDTKVEANTTYKWRFTPTDGNYTVLTGSIELYHKSSSGGSGWYYTYYTIKATAGTNGSISPSGWTSVRDGRDQTFTITPDKGYAVAKVLVDGKSVGAVKSYTFKNVTKDHTIEAIFMKSNGNPQTGVFVDVAEGSYYEEAIDWAVEKGITNGVSSNMFAPNDPCTRAQIVTFLWRAAGSPAPKSMSSFTDVPADAFYAKAVAWAVEKASPAAQARASSAPTLPAPVRRR